MSPVRANSIQRRAWYLKTGKYTSSMAQAMYSAGRGRIAKATALWDPKPSRRNSIRWTLATSRVRTKRNIRGKAVKGMKMAWNVTRWLEQHALTVISCKFCKGDWGYQSKNSIFSCPHSYFSNQLISTVYIIIYITFESCTAKLKSKRMSSNADQTMRIAATGSNISRIITISFTSDSWLPYKRIMIKLTSLGL